MRERAAEPAARNSNQATSSGGSGSATTSPTRSVLLPLPPSQYIRYSCPASSASDRSAEAKPAAVGPHRPRSPGPGTGSLRGSAGATQNVHPLIRRPSAAGLSPPRAGARKVRPGRGFAAASSRALRSGHSARSLAGRRRQAPALGDEKPAGPDLPNSRRCDDTAEPPRACCLRHDRHPLGHSEPASNALHPEAPPRPAVPRLAFPVQSLRLWPVPRADQRIRLVKRPRRRRRPRIVTSCATAGPTRAG